MFRNFGLAVYRFLFKSIIKEQNEKLRAYYAAAFHDGRMLGQIEGQFCAYKDMERMPIVLQEDAPAGSIILRETRNTEGERLIDSLDAIRIQVIQKIGGTPGEKENELVIPIPFTDETFKITG